MPKASRGSKTSTGPKTTKKVAELSDAVKNIVKKTANLKNEQYRIVDSKGNVLIEKRGGKDSVATTVGEKRENLKNNISIHNHPDGGTFSSADLSDFGHGATEIIVAAPEGTYRLINSKHGTAQQYDGWYSMREALEKSTESVSSAQVIRQASENVAKSSTSKKINAITSKWEKIRKEQGNEKATQYLASVQKEYDALTQQRKNEIKAERRRLETKPYHDFYKKNAAKYGFTYVYEAK